jgi:dextranase
MVEVVEVQLRLTWLQHLVSETSHPVSLARGAETVVDLPLALPDVSIRGYGVEALARDGAGEIVARRATALDVLDHWAQAPRYGFLSDFPPDDASAEACAEALARYHINVAQFYDWMWRHYALLPPTDDFTDALGRQLSLRTVREKVAACRRWGIAAYGYAAVYGAEPEYIAGHPDEVAYDASGKPYSLADLFYIMNVAPGSSWRAHIIASMREAVRDVPFDGLHLDQYGMPRDPAFDANGRPLDFPADFATFIDEARTAMQQPDRAVGVIFNAVENWPIERVANTTQDAVYIEVWPPYVSYQDLQALIVNAHRLAPAKQVIIAAYMKPLGEAQDEEALAAAEAAIRLTSAAIWANGGSHLLLGEQNAALHDPYYVNHAILRSEFVSVMRAYYDFVVRYLNVLRDLRPTPLAPSAASEAALQAQVVVDGWHVTPTATAGALWAIARAAASYLTVSLINLSAATSTDWNAAAAAPPELINLRTHIRLVNALPVRGVYAATPDAGDGALHTVRYSAVRTNDEGVELTLDLPSLHYWTLMVIELEPDGDRPGASHQESTTRHDRPHR